MVTLDLMELQNWWVSRRPQLEADTTRALLRHLRSD